MKYPMLCPWVELSQDADGLHLTDTKQGKRFRAMQEYEPILRGLDGRTAPRRLAPDLPEEAVSLLMEQLKTNRLIRQKPFFSTGFLSFQFNIPLAKPTERGRAFAHIFNNVLLKLWLPSLILAVWAWVDSPMVLLDNGIWLGSIVGLILGLVLHELAHACACITYGGQVHSCGLMLWCLLPGAFVELDTDPVKHSLQKVQIFAAGVEMNLYLAAFFLLLAGCHPMLGTPAFCAAMSNGMLALMNLTLTFGLDGMHMLSALLGVEDLFTMALEVLLDKKHRRTLRRKGFQGRAALSFCWMGLAMQMSFPIVLAVNISEVILWVL